MYKVEIEVFEGPFDLLLDLILKQEVDIYEVPLARITEDYLRYLARMEDLNLEVTSEFLVIAATLLELKSIALIPTDEEGYLEEEKETVDTAEFLADHLIEYKTFKNVSWELTKRAETASLLFSREVALEEPFSDLQPDFLDGIRLTDLTLLAKDLLQPRHTYKVDTSHIIALKISLAEKTEHVLASLKQKGEQSFRELCQAATTRMEIIVTFLVLLELFKKGMIAVSQTKTFGDIKVTLKEEGSKDA